MSTQNSLRYSGYESGAIAAPPPEWLESRDPRSPRHTDVSGAFQPHARDRARRVLNVVVASVAMLPAAPLMLVVWLLVRLTSRGPAIYSQPRVGLDGRERGGRARADSRRQRDLGGKVFTIYKFRTMRIDQPATQVWASKNDPRITPVGRFLRSSRLDEIPQLINVLKGDMNIVGPRPEQPEIFATLSEKVGHYRERQRVLPGITGLAQVRLAYDQSIDDVKKKVDLDLEYIRRRSAIEDLMIMARTPAVMVLRKGAM